MPKVNRTMWSVDDRPKVGETSNCLGVRTPPAVRPDVHSHDNKVAPNNGGMSVAPHWTKLPPFLIPKYLEVVVKDARAKPGLCCFCMGYGAFEDGAIDEHLQLKVDSECHGLIVPNRETLISEYQAQLAATQELWIIDESHG